LGVRGLMPWFRVDDNLGFHHKVIAAGNPAMGLWVRAGSVCASQLTDGFVADHVVAALGTVAQAKKLVQVGLWDLAQGGYTFHEWDERQPRRADVEAERAAAKERMKAARDRKRKAAQEASAQVSDPRSEDVRANTSRSSDEVRETFEDPYPTHPNPSLPDPPKEVAPDGATTPGSGLMLVSDNRPEIDRICNHLADRIAEDGSKRPSIGKGWHDAARLMLDRDGHSEAEVHAAIDWCQGHHFWRTNVLSMPKLREKFDQLRKVAQSEQSHPARSSNTNGFLADLRSGGYGPEAIG
jgi:hypothetical protein